MGSLPALGTVMRREGGLQLLGVTRVGPYSTFHWTSLLWVVILGLACMSTAWLLVLGLVAGGGAVGGRGVLFLVSAAA